MYREAFAQCLSEDAQLHVTPVQSTNREGGLLKDCIIVTGPAESPQLWSYAGCQNAVLISNKQRLSERQHRAPSELGSPVHNNES